MSQKASAADEVSTLCNHHVQSGSPDSGGEIMVAPVTCRALVALRAPLLAQHPNLGQCILEGWFSPLQHLDFIQVLTNKL